MKAKVKEITMRIVSDREPIEASNDVGEQGRPAVHGTSARKREKDNKSEREKEEYHRLY